MKKRNIALLATAFFLPLIVVFVFDVRYKNLHNSACEEYTGPSLETACTFPERFEREKLVTTAFYRHIADQFGRKEGTSPSFLDVAANEEVNYDLKERIGRFNLSFAVSLIISIIVATICATLLVQEVATKKLTTG